MQDHAESSTLLSRIIHHHEGSIRVMKNVDSISKQVDSGQWTVDNGQWTAGSSAAVT
jgi:hypothetical protein